MTVPLKSDPPTWGPSSRHDVTRSALDLLLRRVTQPVPRPDPDCRQNDFQRTFGACTTTVIGVGMSQDWPSRRQTNKVEMSHDGTRDQNFNMTLRMEHYYNSVKQE